MWSWFFCKLFFIDMYVSVPLLKLFAYIFNYTIAVLRVVLIIIFHAYPPTFRNASMLMVFSVWYLVWDHQTKQWQSTKYTTKKISMDTFPNSLLNHFHWQNVQSQDHTIHILNICRFCKYFNCLLLLLLYAAFLFLFEY